MERNRSLDGARGLAALSVAIGHCITHTYGLALYPLTVRDFPNMAVWQITVRSAMSIFNADAAVVLFFILSGHVLSRSLETKSQGVSYFVRRAFRLLPVGIITALPFIWVLKPDVLQAIGTALLVDHSVNGVIWSLQIELIGSALIFGLWMAGSRIAAIVAGLALFGAAVHWNEWIILFLPAFCLGFLIPSVPRWLSRSRIAFFGALAVLLFADLWTGRGIEMRVAQMGAAWVLVACLNTRPLKLLESRPAQFLGDVSYPFYLLHPFFMMVLPMHSAIGLAIASIAVTLPICWAVHRAIEMPGVAMGNRLLRMARKQSASGLKATD